MSTSISHPLKTWRDLRDFTHAEAADYINSLHTGDRITPEPLERLEAGISPSAPERMLWEVFISVQPSQRIMQRPLEAV